MSRLAHYWLSKPLAFGVLLTALVLRTLIPAGYMPVSGAPFTLQICHIGFPARLLSQTAHEHVGHGDHGSDHGSPHHASSDSCPFGSAPGAAPIAELPQLMAVTIPVWQSETLAPSPFISSQRLRIHQPRAPPVLV